MNRNLSVGIATCALLGALACDQKTERARGEDLTIVVEADRSKLSAEENDFRNRLREFEAERTRLRDEKAKLMEEKEQLKDKDKSAAQRLRDLEKRIWERERSMWSKEDALESERSKLSKDKTALIDKVATVGKPLAAAPAAAGRGVDLARREKGMADREADLARREKSLAAREAMLAKREAEFLQTQTRLASARPPTLGRGTSAPPRKVSRKDAELAFKAVTRTMQRMGILWGDLPPEVAGLQKDISAAKKSGDYDRARELTAQLEAALSTLVIDSGFIDRKFARLNGLIKSKPPKNKDAVSASLRKATQLVGDGQFMAANRELNRIFALLSR